MAKRIIWSLNAQEDRRNIFSYWNERNKSKVYSRKLNELFKEALKLISDYPEIGTATDDGKARIKIVGDYLIIYEEVEDEKLLILSIWDSRRNPKNLKEKLRK